MFRTPPSAFDDAVGESLLPLHLPKPMVQLGVWSVSRPHCCTPCNKVERCDHNGWLTCVALFTCSQSDGREFDLGELGIHPGALVHENAMAVLVRNEELIFVPGGRMFVTRFLPKSRGMLVSSIPDPIRRNQC